MFWKFKAGKLINLANVRSITALAFTASCKPIQCELLVVYLDDSQETILYDSVREAFEMISSINDHSYKTAPTNIRRGRK